MEKSILMCDNTEGDGKAEIVMDYIMSYSLRHAIDKYLIEKPMLCRYCRYMLKKLIDVDITDKTNIVSVNVWKEWQYMDLCVEVVIKEGETKQIYAVLVENKYYSKLRENQLVDYKKKFDEYYENKEVYVPKENRSYKLVTCHDEDKIEQLYGFEVNKTKDEGGKGFEILSFYDLLPEDYLHNNEVYEETESEIFNEFWLRKW